MSSIPHRGHNHMPHSEPQFCQCCIFIYDDRYCKKSSPRGIVKQAGLRIFSMDDLADSFLLFMISVPCTKKEDGRIFN